jgi:hypothetical protein
VSQFLGEGGSIVTLKMCFLVAHLFGSIWIVQVVEGVWVMTVGGAVSEYYWNHDRQAVGSMPLALLGMYKAVRCHFG